MSNPIQSTGDHSSSDDGGYQTKIIILTRENWVQWSCQLEKFLAGKSHESLLSPPNDIDKVSLKLKKEIEALWHCYGPVLVLNYMEYSWLIEDLFPTPGLLLESLVAKTQL
ncbi:hypothetical protein O181_119173 [Austropuccinia psidii MF-1]|uniref:Uncharacterized protein n=1 Tax=Austropuccinia psidii MF-1 TaxID=1389203 RepID=A0A9Q3KDL5_9BASI|nr:hypothetical protein [Austropuccinia psidii MF-1]